MSDPYRSDEWFKGFEAAHALMECGHSRGDLRDPNYVLGTSGITNCKCVGCAREAALRERIEALAESLTEVSPIVEFYLKREIEAPANHQEFAREAEEKLGRFRRAAELLAALDAPFEAPLETRGKQGKPGGVR